MADAEEYFPRGGKKPSVLFKKSSNFLGAPEKTEKKKKRPKKKADGDDGYLSGEETRQIDVSAKNCAIGLSYKTIKQGVLVLGRVRQIHETVIVMLPCRMIGNIMACHVSEPYNKMLEAYVNDKMEKVPELSQMFRPGQYIALKVLEVEGQSLMLSTMPQHVNGAKQLADIVKGALFQSAVSSIEDHGYVMELGIPNTRAFLPKNDMNPELQLDVGMVTWCAVKSVSTSSDNSIVTLTTSQGYIQGGVLRHKQTTPLLPGTTVEFTVDTPLDNGIEGTIFGDTTCYIQRQHVDKVKGKKPALGQKIRARVLYVMPTRNSPFLTMKNIFESTYPDLQAELKHLDGDIIEEAQVLKIIGRSVHMKLGGGTTAILSLRRIQVNEDLTDEDVVAKSYPIGSTHKVRVLCYNLSDYVYSVTDEPDVVRERYFSLHQLSPGDLVPATVRTVSERTVELSVGRVKGFVPQNHLSETGLFVDPKKAHNSKLHMKKFKVGQSVTARVLSVDPVKQSLALTLKPSLLAPDLQVLASYEQAEIGKAYVGVVRKMSDYMLVSFFNNVTAFIPRNCITRSDEDVTNSFHVGQTVTCTVIDSTPEQRKLVASLITQPFVYDEKWEAKRNKIKRKNQDRTEEIPNKKQKNEEDDAEPKKKKKKQNDTESSQDNIEPENSVKEKKKKKRTDAETSNENNTQEESIKDIKKKKKKRNDTENSDIEESPKEIIKKKKKRTDTETSNKNNTQEESTLDSKKKKKKRIDTENSDIEDSTKEIIKKKKKRTDTGTSHDNTHEDDSPSEIQKKEIVSEESDAIETDIHDDEEILTPHEQGLLDMSDCTTIQQYKKRSSAQLKAIDARARRIEVIETKIESMEERGLTAKNKKYHTAMQSEKLLLQERTKILLEALNTAQEKLKQMGVEKNDSYKEEQKKRKLEKLKAAKENKKLQVKEKENNASASKKDDKLEDTYKLYVKDKLKEIKVVESLKPALEVPSAKDFWSDNTDLPSNNVQEEELSSSEDESNDQPKKKRKKLTVAEKLAKAREEEERVRAMERAAIDSEAQPRSVEQFERSVLANPSSSQLWIAYMAFHLQATELEKARAVARKALNTIPFREEQEKLNVWLALINLEQRFGTKESQQKTLEDALQLNEPYKVHAALLDILLDTGKHQELTSLVDLMIRKYKRDPQMYNKCGGACFKLGLVDKARQVMQKAIAVLEKKEHVNVLVHFALLERSHGGRERAEALFEQVLAVYPQRVDVCSVYVDMLLTTHDVQQVRQVMERMTSQKLPARKMKILFKKWVEVEEKHGDETQVETIKQRALEFIEKAKF